MISKKTGSGKHSMELRQNDCYETPLIALEKLVQHVTLPRHIYEPACGPGAIVNFLRNQGHSVYASDLVEYEGIQADWNVDFLATTEAPFDCIVTNPPYNLATPFVEHALKMCNRVIMLLRLSFIESESRTHILGCPSKADPSL